MHSAEDSVPTTERSSLQGVFMRKQDALKGWTTDEDGKCPAPRD